VSVTVVAVPLESFTVVMATGIVAVAARDDHHPAVALVLTVAAGAGLVALLAWAAVARGMIGRAVAGGANPMERTCGLFGFVAAADVVAAQFDPPTSGLVAACGVAALAAWVVLLPRLAGTVRTSGRATLFAGARGSWLLVAVATQSLALVAARLSAVGPGAEALVVASVVWWVAGVLAYLVTVALVVRRLVRARLSPALLTPDMWVLMGAVAIAVVAGGSTADALRRVPGFAGLTAVSYPALLGCWLVATAWIPLLVAAEARRARARRPGYEPARWATVFPLGMYAVACVTLASFTPAIRGVLIAVSGSMFWVALSAWCLTAAGLLARLRRLRHGTTT
jgi:voltage-gated anion channel